MPNYKTTWTRLTKVTTRHNNHTPGTQKQKKRDEMKWKKENKKRNIQAGESAGVP